MAKNWGVAPGLLNIRQALVAVVQLHHLNQLQRTDIGECSCANGVSMLVCAGLVYSSASYQFTLDVVIVLLYGRFASCNLTDSPKVLEPYRH